MCLPGYCVDEESRDVRHRILPKLIGHGRFLNQYCSPDPPSKFFFNSIDPTETSRGNPFSLSGPLALLAGVSLRIVAPAVRSMPPQSPHENVPAIVRYIGPCDALEPRSDATGDGPRPPCICTASIRRRTCIASIGSTCSRIYSAASFAAAHDLMKLAKLAVTLTASAC
jgi:hypothetical protein